MILFLRLAGLLETALATRAALDRERLARQTDGLLRVMTPDDVRDHPGMARHVAGLLNTTGLSEQADRVLDLAADEPDPAIENLRGLLAAARGDNSRAMTIWSAAMRLPARDRTETDRIRANLAVLALRMGDPQRARALVEDLAAAPHDGPANLTAVLSAAAATAADAWLDQEVPHDRLDRMRRVVTGLSTEAGLVTRVRITAELAAIHVEVVAATGDWERAEDAMEVLELAAQTMGATLGSKDPATLSIRVLTAAAEARWAAATGSGQRADHAVAVLAGLLDRCRQWLGEADRVTVRAHVELAVVRLALAERRPDLEHLERALRSAQEAAAAATALHGDRHPAAVQAASALYDSRQLAARRFGLEPYLMPAPRPDLRRAGAVLSVKTVRAQDDTVQVHLAWPEASPRVVRIRHSDRPPPWEPGTTIAVERLEEYGSEVDGAWLGTDDGLVLAATLPREERQCVAFAVEDGWAVVGTVNTALVTCPVEDLQARRLGDRVVAGWHWPEGVRQARVSWTTPERGPLVRTLTKAEYDRGGGCVQEVGRGGGVLSVRAVVPGTSGEILSDPRETTVGGVTKRLNYRFDRPAGLFRRQHRTVRLWADEECAGISVTVILTQGPRLPLDPDSGQVLLRATGLRVSPGEELVLGFEVPSGTARPFVLRCSVDSEEPLAVIDPPVLEPGGSRAWPT
ncbi:tetratricopeptide repeat protein [Actinoplanes sp. GCM10030250]|uniref:tetratricopeptide repeat protein n=1 Tax=Actinoplanes sp. GCM10030250 TaxID=3273376 RepID=UPI003606F31C